MRWLSSRCDERRRVQRRNEFTRTFGPDEDFHAAPAKRGRVLAARALPPFLAVFMESFHLPQHANLSHEPWIASLTRLRGRSRFRLRGAP